MEKHVVEIEAPAHGGHGVCRISGQVCFVPYALPGDTVRVQVEKKTKGVLWASVEEVLDPSAHRTPVSCPVFGKCGGCSWLHFSYPGQAEAKQRIIQDCLKRIGGIDIPVQWVEEETLRLGYRTRATFHRDGPHWGFFENGTRSIVEIGECPLCHPKLNEALARLRAVPHRGSVELQVNPEGDEVLAWCPKPAPRLAKVFPLSNHLRHARRASFLFDGVPIVNGAFAQSSLPLNRTLVRTVHQMIGEAENVLDLYCGTGNLSLGLPDSVSVFGLDHNRAAIEAAASVGRGDYQKGGESQFCEALAQHKWDVVLLDPPRTGARAITEALQGCRARKIVYISCEPATLARDASILAKGGWTVAQAAAVDMFPHTAHIETVCRFERT